MIEGYEEGEICNRGGCAGLIEINDEGCCSCHISPPCSYCVDDKHFCPECGWSGREEQHYVSPVLYALPPLYEYRSPTERFNALKGDKVEWVDITPKENYYFMVEKGKYPEGTTREEILSHFDVCFGYAYLHMSEGVFEIKYYTD